MSIVKGTNLSEALYGTNNTDGIEGFAGNDFLFGYDGNDYLTGGYGNDYIDGGAGFDEVYFNDHVGNASILTGWNIDLIGGKATTNSVGGSGLFQLYLTETDTLLNVEKAYGSYKNDTFNMNDTQSANGLGGDDVAEIHATAAHGKSGFSGGDGIDTVRFTTLAQGVSVVLDDLRDANAYTRDTAGSFARAIAQLDHVENVVGSTHNDYLRGDANVANVLNGYLGDDTLQLSATMAAGKVDTFVGGAGTDTLYANYFLNDGLKIVLNNPGTANGMVEVRATAAHGSYLVGQVNTIENVIGSGNDDNIYGNNQANVIDGSYGDDFIIAGAGSDKVIGGAGRDYMMGAADGHRDGVMDTFIFKATSESATRQNADSIVDYELHVDKIDLSAIDAKLGTAANDAFSFIGSHAFTGVAGQLHYVVASGNTYVEADVNGDRVADMSIAVAGNHALLSTDFIL